MEAQAEIRSLSANELKNITNEELVTHFEALVAYSGRNQIRGQGYVKNTLRQEILQRMKK